MNVYMDCIVDRTFNPKDCEIVLAVVHQEFYRLSTCHLDILRGSHIDAEASCRDHSCGHAHALHGRHAGLSHGPCPSRPPGPCMSN